MKINTTEYGAISFLPKLGIRYYNQKNLQNFTAVSKHIYCGSWNNGTDFRTKAQKTSFSLGYY